jgi:hypothetical protein
MEESTKTILLVFSGGLAGAILTQIVQAVARWLRRPRLVLVQYEHRPPMYRLAPDVQSGKKVFWVNVGVRNQGRSVAERCRAVVTAMAELKQDSWVKDRNWLPPTSQHTSFPPGIYGVQITVYSANGEWAVRWYELILRGGTGSFTGDRLTVRELSAAPVTDL